MKKYNQETMMTTTTKTTATTRKRMSKEDSKRATTKSPPIKGKPTQAKSKPNTTTTSSSTTTTDRNGPICIGPPDEKIDGGWPPGWIRTMYQRKSGVSKSRMDRYWISPQQQLRFRSIIDVKRFLIVLQECEGDETLAQRKVKPK
jgi:hypothetical protein